MSNNAKGNTNTRNKLIELYKRNGTTMEKNALYNAILPYNKMDIAHIENNIDDILGLATVSGINNIDQVVSALENAFKPEYIDFLYYARQNPDTNFNALKNVILKKHTKGGRRRKTRKTRKSRK